MPPIEDTDAEGGYIRLGDNEGRQQQQEAAASAVPKAKSSTPWLLWPVFAFAVTSGATSGPITYLIQSAAPISLAGWRHQISSLAMLPAFIYEIVHLDPPKRKVALSSRNLGLQLLSSLALAAHFATYVWALYNTSLPHCLFLTNISPIFVALFVKATGGTLQLLELGGIALSLLGIGVFAIGNNVEGEDTHSTYIGDLVAVSSAVTMAIYLLVGKGLRSSMPLFVYQFPVTFSSMIVLTLAGLLFEGWNESDEGPISGPFGWRRKEYLWKILWLGVIPGFFGHVGYSYVLKYSSPLVMPAGLSLQPIIGTFLSWLFGETPIPGAWTWGGGFMTLSGTTAVNVTSTLRRTKSEENNDGRK